MSENDREIDESLRVRPDRPDDDAAPGDREPGRLTRDQRSLRNTFGSGEPQSGAYHIDRGRTTPSHRKPGERRAGRIIRRLRRPFDRGLKLDQVAGHRVGLMLERDMQVRLKDIQASIKARRHRTEGQQVQIRVLAEYMLRYNEIGVPQSMLEDALSCSESTVKRLLKDAQKARDAGIDPWTGEPGDADWIVR